MEFLNVPRSFIKLHNQDSRLYYNCKYNLVQNLTHSEENVGLQDLSISEIRFPVLSLPSFLFTYYIVIIYIP